MYDYTYNYTHTSLWVLSFVLPACKPNFAPSCPHYVKVSAGLLWSLDVFEKVPQQCVQDRPLYSTSYVLTYSVR